MSTMPSLQRSAFCRMGGSQSSTRSSASREPTRWRRVSSLLRETAGALRWSWSPTPALPASPGGENMPSWPSSAKEERPARSSSGTGNRCPRSLRKFRPLRHVRDALEVDPVAVRVRERCDPHAVPHEGFRGLDPSSSDLSVDRQSVVADEADRHALPHLPGGHPGIVPFLARLLQHQGRAPVLQPAPAELPLIDPFVGHLESEPIDVIADGLVDVRHPEKWHGLLDVRLGLVRHATKEPLMHRRSSFPCRPQPLPGRCRTYSASACGRPRRARCRWPRSASRRSSMETRRESTGFFRSAWKRYSISRATAAAPNGSVGDLSATIRATIRASLGFPLGPM